MSRLVNCVYCQGQGTKMHMFRGKSMCVFCSGKRKIIYGDRVYHQDEVSRYDQNINWKAMTMDSVDLRTWALKKFITRDMRRNFKHLVGRQVNSEIQRRVAEALRRTSQRFIDAQQVQILRRIFNDGELTLPPSMVSHPGDVVANQPYTYPVDPEYQHIVDAMKFAMVSMGCKTGSPKPPGDDLEKPPWEK